jgi:hypothetical protein
VIEVKRRVEEARRKIAAQVQRSGAYLAEAQKLSRSGSWASAVDSMQPAYFFVAGDEGGGHRASIQTIRGRGTIEKLFSAHSTPALVLPFVVAGFANKETVGELGTSEITIGVHRGQIMRKAGARPLAELVRMTDKFSIAPTVRPS